MTPVSLRIATAADLDEVVALDAACFDAPWPAASWAAELARSFCTVALAVDAATGRTLGFSCDWCLPTREAHLLRLATVPRARRRGVARRLLDAVVDRARVADCEMLWLEVGARNDAAVQLYVAAGFTEVARRRGYYRRPPDDALVMRRDPRRRS